MLLALVQYCVAVISNRIFSPKAKTEAARRGYIARTVGWNKRSKVSLSKICLNPHDTWSRCELEKGKHFGMQLVNVTYSLTLKNTMLRKKPISVFKEVIRIYWASEVTCSRLKTKQNHKAQGKPDWEEKEWIARLSAPKQYKDSLENFRKVRVSRRWKAGRKNVGGQHRPMQCPPHGKCNGTSGRLCMFYLWIKRTISPH